jgi:hypothetical protein
MTLEYVVAEGKSIDDKWFERGIPTLGAALEAAKRYAAAKYVLEYNKTSRNLGVVPTGRAWLIPEALPSVGGSDE